MRRFWFFDFWYCRANLSKIKWCKIRGGFYRWKLFECQPALLTVGHSHPPWALRNLFLCICLLSFFVTYQSLSFSLLLIQKPHYTVSPTANQSPVRLAQNSQSTRSTGNKHPLTPQTVPRTLTVSQSTPRPIVQSPVKPGQSMPRTILYSQLTPLSIKSGTQIVKAKPVQSALPSSIRLVTKAVPGSLDTSRLTFKVMKHPNGNTFLVQEKCLPAGNKSLVVPSSPKSRHGVNTAITTTPKVKLVYFRKCQLFDVVRWREICIFRIVCFCAVNFVLYHKQ